MNRWFAAFVEEGGDAPEVHANNVKNAKNNSKRVERGDFGGFDNFDTPPTPQNNLPIIDDNGTLNSNVWTASDWQYYFDERAGIYEFDGQLECDQAEKEAFKACVVRWLNIHPLQAHIDTCIHCHAPCHNSEGSTITVLNGDGYTNIHKECLDEWNITRVKQAISALNQLGVSYAQ